MKCAYCGNVVDDSNPVKDNTKVFCNNLCRYSFSKENGIPTNNSFEIHGDTRIESKSNSNSKFPYAAFWASVVYFIIIYFLICTLSGAIVGGIAGAQNPANASLAGAKASVIFVQRYMFFIIVLAFMITEHGILAKWLPFIKKLL